MAVMLVSVLVAGCGAAGAGGKQLTLGYLEWDENVANSNLIKVILEDDFGYDQVQLKLDGVQPIFQGLSDGELDAFMDAWMPNHKTYMKKIQGKAELSKKPWYLGQTKYGIAVPDYMSDVKSIADLNSSGAASITGIEPGAVLMHRIENVVIPEYHLHLDLVEGSTPAMLEELNRAYHAKEPFVFLAWSPHWMNEEYDFHYLKDPKNAMGELDEPNKLHSVFREGLADDDPVAYALINAMRLTEKQVGTLELSIRRAQSPEEGARDWLKNHRDVVRPWIEAAKRAEG